MEGLNLKTFVVVNGNEYMVSTVYVYVLGWETMVFRTIGDQTVVDWQEIDKYTRRYFSEEKAREGHRETIIALRSDA